MQLSDATVLVVDDEPMLRDIFEEWLRGKGCRVLTAENGAAALDCLSAAHIDVVVTDVRMPVMDGVGLVEAINEAASASGQHLPKVIFISGFSDLSERDLQKMGVETILQKPIDRTRFIDAVKNSLAP